MTDELFKPKKSSRYSLDKLLKIVKVTNNTIKLSAEKWRSRMKGDGKKDYEKILDTKGDQNA